MGIELIKGVFFYPVEPIKTTGGKVLHAIKALDKNLTEFGECYFSICDYKQPKAWKKHAKMICNLFVPSGEVKFVFYDDRQDSSDFGKVAEFSTSQNNYGRLVINPGIWFGFTGMSESENLILNVANISHDANESLRLEPGTNQIPYQWKFD